MRKVVKLGELRGVDQGAVARATGVDGRDKKALGRVELCAFKGKV